MWINRDQELDVLQKLTRRKLFREADRNLLETVNELQEVLC